MGRFQRFALAVFFGIAGTIGLVGGYSLHSVASLGGHGHLVAVEADPPFPK